MPITRAGRTALGLAAGVLMLGTTACGDDAPATPPKAECAVAAEAAGALPDAVDKYRSSGKNKDLLLDTGVDHDAASRIHDVQLRDVAARLIANNVAFSETPDPAFRSAILVQQKANYDEFIQLCGPSFPPGQKASLDKTASSYPTTLARK